MTASAETENGFPARAPSSMFVPSKTRTGTPTVVDVRNALGQFDDMMTIFASPFLTALSACWTPKTTFPVVTAVFNALPISTICLPPFDWFVFQIHGPGPKCDRLPHYDVLRHTVQVILLTLQRGVQ